MSLGRVIIFSNFKFEEDKVNNCSSKSKMLDNAKEKFRSSIYLLKFFSEIHIAI